MREKMIDLDKMLQQHSEELERKTE